MTLDIFGTGGNFLPVPIEKRENIKYNRDTIQGSLYNILKFLERGNFMTALRQSAIRELEKIPEDKIGFILQIMQGVNGLYHDSQPERKEAFVKLEKLRKKGSAMDYDAELASYREEKYGR